MHQNFLNLTLEFVNFCAFWAINDNTFSSCNLHTMQILDKNGSSKLLEPLSLLSWLTGHRGQCFNTVKVLILYALVRVRYYRSAFNTRSSATAEIVRDAYVGVRSLSL